MHILRSGSTSQVVWHHLRVSISMLSRLTGEKRIVTSGDHPVTSDSQLHPDLHRWGLVTMILKELGSFDWFMRNGKYFHISP